jgi:hypothetical protein
MGKIPNDTLWEITSNCGRDRATGSATHVDFSRRSETNESRDLCLKAELQGFVSLHWGSKRSENIRSME